MNRLHTMCPMSTQYVLFYYGIAFQARKYVQTPKNWVFQHAFLLGAVDDLTAESCGGNGDIKPRPSAIHQITDILPRSDWNASILGGDNARSTVARRNLGLSAVCRSCIGIGEPDHG